ncbi:MAG: hypothetical protein ACD_3C00226G0002 [uncultured bacterium (gcode 4)]|uniref:Uncharacterized protein n=1 Tax=uncultured bacterium (gcode 4) TaxID=1234023 RepID=K2FWB8_9BACT|nr:MAG: hypothetical protein ACD_3C00226G0002 [uncultured bacterium (gcode 4)]
MKKSTYVSVLVLLIFILSTIAALTWIFSNDGTDPFIFKTILWENIEIYGKGIYKHMSTDVAIQWIAQDYVTLFVWAPLLLISLYLYRRNNLKWKILLLWTLFYFFLTYLFYTAMAMYNSIFLVYVSLLCFSFFALFTIFPEISNKDIENIYECKIIVKYISAFLIINCIMIAILWLNVILPPLFDWTIYPESLQHYTTLIVQGFDLWLFLPIGFVSSIMALNKNRYWFVFVSAYIVFLSILMLALVSKIIFMANSWANVVPVIFIISVIFTISLILTSLLFMKMKEN